MLALRSVSNNNAQCSKKARGKLDLEDTAQGDLNTAGTQETDRATKLVLSTPRANTIRSMLSAYCSLQTRTESYDHVRIFLYDNRVLNFKKTVQIYRVFKN